MNKKNKYIIFYGVAHSISFLCIYILAIILLFTHIESIVLRLIGAVLLLFVCGLIEERVMVFLINPIVWIFLPPEIRKTEIENVRRYFKKNTK